MKTVLRTWLTSLLPKLYWLAPVAILLFLGYSFLPLLLPDNIALRWYGFADSDFRGTATPSPDDAERWRAGGFKSDADVVEAVRLRGIGGPAEMTVGITPFVAVAITPRFEVDNKNFVVSWASQASLFVRSAGVAFALLILAIFTFSIRLLVTTRSANYLGTTIREMDVSVDAALRLEATRAWEGAQRFYTGSIYLLVSGVVMSFVGMGIFVWTYPAIVGSESGNDHWGWLAPSIRGIGLLVFVEAVAWFLLRQYRAATEDFKAFHRIYLRRTNLFIARQALAEITSFEKSRKIAEALLSEDQSGRLSEGQSTEAIEAMKVDESNPVFKLFSDALHRVSENHGEKPKSKKGAEEK